MIGPKPVKRVMLSEVSSPCRIKSRAELMAQMVPTEYERRSCAGMGPRLRAMEVQVG